MYENTVFVLHTMQVYIVNKKKNVNQMIQFLLYTRLKKF
jgi:hypothetical protein